MGDIGFVTYVIHIDGAESRPATPAEIEDCKRMARYFPAPRRPMPDVFCKCGHASGAHDDEPEGCWYCDCDAWSLGRG